MTNDIVFHKTIGREEGRDMEELLKLSSSSSFPSRVYFARGGEVVDGLVATSPKFVGISTSSGNDRKNAGVSPDGPGKAYCMFGSRGDMEIEASFSFFSRW